MCLPSSLSDGIVFIAWYKYNQNVPIKLCYYCSTKLDMLEVSASWLFHVAMNILWERKYLVSDSFYSAATHRAGNLPDLSKIKSVACPSLCSFLPQIHRRSALLRFPCSLGEWVDSRDVWGALSDPNERPKPEELATHQLCPTPAGTLRLWSALGEVCWRVALWAVNLKASICISFHAAECPVATRGWDQPLQSLPSSWNSKRNR